MLAHLFKKKDDGLDFIVQWGGYYSHKEEDGSYRVFRLLDFNQSAIHYQIYQKHFEHAPTMEEVK